MKAETFSSVKENKQWFLDNKEELMKSHAGKYLLIVNKELIKSAKESFPLAVLGRKDYGQGNFCVTICGDQPVMWINPIITVTYA